MRGTHYVSTRDGTRLAAFIHRPEHDGPVPALLILNRYNKTSPNPGHIAAWLGQWSFLSRLPLLRAPAEGPDPKRSVSEVPWLGQLCEAGFAIAIVDGRGTGSSFGHSRGPFDPIEAQDGADVIAWVAAQPWCNGRVGMLGRSYMGTNQLLAASTEPPALGAVFPQMPLFDVYDFIRGGGVFREDFARSWTGDVARRDFEVAGMRLDEDPDGTLLRRALSERGRGVDVYRTFSALEARDDRDPATARALYLEHSPARTVLARGRVTLPCHLLSGWFDCFSRDAIDWWHNLSGPRRLVIGPWAHEGSFGYDLADEHLSWYGHWLAERSADIMEEPPVHYYTVGAPQGSRWRAASSWPPAGFGLRPLHLGPGPSGSVRSCNDGRLGWVAPTDEAADEYRVDGRTTSGRATRWTHGYGGPYGYDDMRPNDERSLTYTSAPLDRDMEMTGHPLVHLWVRADVADVQFFAFLEEVDPDGESDYVTEGALKLSHRARHEPKWSHGGLPWHRGHRADLLPAPDRPVELVFDLLPLSRRIARGQRLRLAVCCADHHNAQTPAGTVGTRVRLHHGPAHPSRLLLPLATT